MPSLKDLAKECGVSVATVSKALNDQPDISPATRERVRAAAHRMGYLPNAAARSLKTNRTYNLGVLFVDERQSGLTHEYFSAVLDSFKVEAEKHGYDITFINHNISGKSMSYLEHCRYRNVDGVVIACVNFYEPQVVERHRHSGRLSCMAEGTSGGDLIQLLPSSLARCHCSPFCHLRDIFPRPGEVFLIEGGSGEKENFAALPRAPSLRELSPQATEGVIKKAPAVLNAAGAFWFTDMSRCSRC